MSSRWRHYLRPGVLVLVTGVSLYTVLPSLVAVFAASRSLTHLTWYWALLALVSEAASFVSLWELDRIALAEQSWFLVGTSQLSGNAVGRIVPGGAATATAFTVGMLQRAGVKTGRSAVALAASTSLQVGTRLALPVLAVPAIVAGAPVDRGLARSAYLGAFVLVLLVAAGVITFAFDRPLATFGRGLQWLLNATVRRRRKLTDLPDRLLAQRDFVRSTIGPRWRAAVLAAAGSTAFDFVALLCALRAVGAQPRPSLLLLAYTAASLLALVPLTPGGLGFVEAGLVGTLTLAGVSGGDAVLATLTYRLVSFWLPIPAGGVAYAAYRRRYPQPGRARAHFAQPICPGADAADAALSEGRGNRPRRKGMASPASTEIVISDREVGQIERANASGLRPVVFIHGLWLLSSSWDRWVTLFEEAGYVGLTPGWPDDPETVADAEADPEVFAQKGIGQVADYQETVIRGLEQKPAVLGHSFGGLLTQILAGRGLSGVSVAIDPAPFRGVLPLPVSELRAGEPVLKNPANYNRAVPLTYDEFRYAFANAVSEDEAKELYDAYSVPGPGKPLFQAAAANLNPWTEAKVDTKNPERGPLLIIEGEDDHTVPPAVAKAAYERQQRNEGVTEYVELPGRGHALTIDHGWREVADTALDFVRRFV